MRRGYAWRSGYAPPSDQIHISTREHYTLYGHRRDDRMIQFYGPPCHEYSSQELEAYARELGCRAVGGRFEFKL